MDRRRLLRQSLPRLVVSWAGLTGAVIAGGAQALLLARPVFEARVEALMPAYVAHLQPRAAGSREPGGDVVLVVHATRPDPISGDHVVTPWIEVQESINAGHELVPTIILMSLLAAWPWRRWRDAAIALGAGVCAAALLLAWTVPVHLAGLYELNLQKVAGAFNEVRAAPWFLDQMIFLESGGLWLMPLLLAAAIVLGISRFQGPAARP